MQRSLSAFEPEPGRGAGTGLLALVALGRRLAHSRADTAPHSLSLVCCPWRRTQVLKSHSLPPQVPAKVSHIQQMGTLPIMPSIAGLSAWRTDEPTLPSPKALTVARCLLLYPITLFLRVTFSIIFKPRLPHGPRPPPLRSPSTVSTSTTPVASSRRFLASHGTNSSKVLPRIRHTSSATRRLLRHSTVAQAVLIAFGEPRLFASTSLTPAKLQNRPDGSARNDARSRRGRLHPDHRRAELHLCLVRESWSRPSAPR